MIMTSPRINSIYYTIVGKGNSGQNKCSGKIIEGIFPTNLLDSIEIILYDKLHVDFVVLYEVQIDELTVRYICYKSDELSSPKEYVITKYKYSNKQNVYLYSFPSLCDGDMETSYKAIKSEYEDYEMMPF